MAATLFLIIGLILVGFVWALAIQMRYFVFRVLVLNTREIEPELSDADSISQTRSATYGKNEELLNKLEPTCSNAIRHLHLARHVSLIMPFPAITVIVLWRFVLGGGA